MKVESSLKKFLHEAFALFEDRILALFFQIAMDHLISKILISEQSDVNIFFPIQPFHDLEPNPQNSHETYFPQNFNITAKD